MFENIVAFFNDPVRVSTTAAAISALTALLTYLSSKKLSRRDMVDILKVEILEVVSSAHGRNAWFKMLSISGSSENGVTGVRADGIAGLLGVGTKSRILSWFRMKSKYERRKWIWLLPVTVEELKREGYQNLLGL